MRIMAEKENILNIIKKKSIKERLKNYRPERAERQGVRGNINTLYIKYNPNLNLQQLPTNCVQKTNTY